MRRFTILFILLALIITGCGQSREDNIRDLAGVQLFDAMNGGLEYSERHFEGEDAQSIADLVSAECPQGVGDDFYRVMLDAKSTSLVLYTDATGTNVTCSILKPKAQRPVIVKTLDDAPNKSIAILVNGEPITVAQVQQLMAALPRGSQLDDATLNLIANRAINDELLRQEAEMIEVTDEDIASARRDILASAGTDEAGLPSLLEERGVSQEQFDASVQSQARLTRLFKERLLTDTINVSEDAVKDYYLSNPNAFLKSEQAVMRQILITANGRTIDEGRSRATYLLNQLESRDFCELVKEFSDDTQSRDKCGMYIIPRGVIDANLELASFNTPANQTAVVTTETGIHLVQTLQVVPAQVVPYSQVAQNVLLSLRNQEFEQRLNLYLTTLRNDAEIVSYLG